MTNAWLERWENGKIGWHQPDGHPSIRRHWVPNGGPVLVPLCGKAVDMLHLAKRGHSVTGVEISEIAVREFFADNGLSCVVTGDSFPEYRATDADIRLVVADFFEFRESGFTALYDRAALIALPREQRARYATHLHGRLEPGAFELLVTVDYAQEKIAGPPFAVGDEEVESLFPELRCIERNEDVENSPPKFRSAGVESLVESVWVSGS